MPQQALGTGAAARWRDRVLTLRDRLLGSGRFQRWAAAFPLTRRVAHRHAREAFDLCAGFVYSQVLYACVRLRLLDALARRPRSVADLASRSGLGEEAMHRLLRAAASLRLVEVRGGERYGLGAIGAVIAGHPGIPAMVEHHALLYGDLADPLALLRGTHRDTGLARYWPYAGSEAPASPAPGAVADYTALMSATQSWIAAEVLDAYPVERHACLLDVGGGDGTFLAAAAERAGGLRLMLFDLPAVAERARGRFAAAGLAARTSVHGGDFRIDALPAGADLVSLVRVLHDHDDATARILLRAARAALAPRGAVLVAEPMAGTAGAERVGDAYFGFYLLAMGSGRPRTPAEIGALLAESGFERARRIATRTPLLAGVMVARSR